MRVRRRSFAISSSSSAGALSGASERSMTPPPPLAPAALAPAWQPPDSDPKAPCASTRASLSVRASHLWRLFCGQHCLDITEYLVALGHLLIKPHMSRAHANTEHMHCTAGREERDRPPKKTLFRTSPLEQKFNTDSENGLRKSHMKVERPTFGDINFGGNEQPIF
jgi:hypothetical protein